MKLWKDGLADRLELAPLTTDDFDQLLRERLGADVDGLTRQQLWEASGGNLSLHQELVTAGLETGALRTTDDVWSWHGPLIVTPRLLELTWSRVGPLGKEHVRGLELCAIGGPIGIEDMGNLVAADVLEDLETRQVLVAERLAGRIVLRFRYPIDAEVIRAQIPELRSRRHRLALTKEMEGKPGGRADENRIVSWKPDSDLGQPVETLVTAMRRAPATERRPASRSRSASSHRRPNASARRRTAFDGAA